eukprot:287229-Chlamydomonas_euryale.AAC.7
MDKLRLRHFLGIRVSATKVSTLRLWLQVTDRDCAGISTRAPKSIWQPWALFSCCSFCEDAGHLRWDVRWLWLLCGWRSACQQGSHELQALVPSIAPKAAAAALA